jgi:hypothetical protein
MRTATVTIPSLASVLVVAASISVASAEPPRTPPPNPTATGAQLGTGTSASERNRAFLQHLFQDVLGRPADATALAQYGNLLGQGSASRSQIAQTVLGSSEGATVVVSGLYSRLLHRQPDAQSLALFVSLLQHGGTAEQVEAQLITSEEYAQRAGGGWLDQAYQDLLGRHFDAASRQQIAQTVMATDEFAGVVIASLYQKYLRRQADPQGLLAMRAIFRQGGSAMVSTVLLGSEEYYLRP